MAYTTINNGREYFEPQGWTGSGSARSISTLDFQPDWTWIKHRNGTSNHNLFDVIRGATIYIESSSTAPNQTGTDRLTSFNSNGFSLGTNGGVNADGDTYMSWNWKAGGTGVSNTDGDVTSTVSANTTAGFSIVKWNSTGTAGINIGHGLGKKPKMIISKCININGTSWPVYHVAEGATVYLSWNLNIAGTTSATRWNNSEPTTTTFQTGSSGDIGGSDRTMLAYCFTDIPGYSKFGKYAGNGSSDGTFVYTGFKPAFLMTKVITTTGDWQMCDWKRASAVNPINKDLRPNNSDSETTNTFVDFYSNGFKLRNNFGNWNGSGQEYAYMCFAQSPVVGTNNIPATGR